MITVRPINFDKEFPIVQSWWTKRGTPAMPEAAFMSAQGFVSEASGVMVAVSWLYVVPGTKGGIGIVEFTTTNPSVAWGKDLLLCAKALYAHVEDQAWAQGCGSLLSFVAPNGSEQHIFDKSGWKDVTGGQAHLLYGKAKPCQ